MEMVPSTCSRVFTTVACGAISGFHSLVSSGTTSSSTKRLTRNRSLTAECS
ncbi:MAG: carbon starvation CstA family protein [Clostridiaceae bacterium]